MADKTIYSPTERRIQEHLAKVPDAELLRHMAKELEAIVTGWERRNINRDVQAAAMCVHLVSVLTAMKIAVTVPPDFIDLLADDVVDSVKGRAHPGVQKWLTSQ